MPPMRCFLGVVKTDQQTQIQTIGFRKLNKLVFVEYLLSLRASAHTGVAIPPLRGTR